MKRQRIRRTILFFFFLSLPLIFNYFSPYLMITGAAQRIVTGSLVVWSLYFVASVVLGRAACGWFCPFHGLQMIWEKVSDTPLRRVRYLRGVKYVLWVAWVGALLVVALGAGGFDRIDLRYSVPSWVSIDSAAANVTYVMLVGLTLAGLAFGKRGFCQYLCPFGGYMIAGSKLGRAVGLPQLHLKAVAGLCTECGRCERECPMSLPVREMVAEGDMRDTECILCGGCVDGCRSGAIHYAFGRRSDRTGG